MSGLPSRRSRDGDPSSSTARSPTTTPRDRRARGRARRRPLLGTRNRRVEQGGARRADPRDPSRCRPQLGRPALQRPDLRCVLRSRRHVPRHGDDALGAASDESLRGDRDQARRLPVRARRSVGGEGTARTRRDRHRAGRRRRLRPLRRRRALLRDRRGRDPRRREPRRRGLRLRPHLLDLDDDRGVPQPACRSGRRTAAGSRPRRSRSPRSSTSPRGSARSSA